ncbi:hypothetical protein [Methanogenium organophilum]|uniref:P/Homo B domain-containing protein n=1 Tax=Methanogenium organophilum TaxID=2199 RepID=A0A9X9S3U3_METOG|nr:hypothetical protein [Methanogenium organophilum]WAI00988.1 hypothetical protein OU421_11285 [Methanogenium organophilum]
MTALLLAALAIAPAAAGDVMERVETGEIIVIPSVDKYNPDLSGSRVINQITQGETIRHLRYVWPFTSKIDVTLTWDEHFGDLELSVISPDGDFVGHYTDLYDSSVKDGVIDVDIKTSSGFLPMGDWELRVYGREVFGSSVSYTLL